MSAVRTFLQQRLDEGAWTLGQVLAAPDFSLRHFDDASTSELRVFTAPEDAREIAKYDEAGNYRPLKTAPNLRRGWHLRLGSLGEMHTALDFLYPAAVGTLAAFDAGDLVATPLRETLGRQTGMYRVTQLITDEQAADVIRDLCETGCIRRRLWGISSVRSPDIPAGSSAVLCAEACNLLVAGCRPVAKRNLPQSAGNDQPGASA